MTLCVAKATKKQIIMLSDTRINDPRTGARGNLASGMVKTALLSDSAAVCFTGNPEVAQTTLLEFRAKFGDAAPFSQTLAFFASQTTDNENDYLIGFSGPKRIFKISGGKIQEGSDLWIGDYDGFCRFQEGIRPRPESIFWESTMAGIDFPEKEMVFDKIARFKEVCEDPAVETVGDFFTLAVGLTGRFQLCPMSTLYFDNAVSPILGPDGNPILTATGENRSFRYAIWTAREPGASAAAFVFAGVKRAFAYVAPDRGFANTFIDLSGLERDTTEAELRARTGVDFLGFEAWHP